MIIARVEPPADLDPGSRSALGVVWNPAALAVDGIVPKGVERAVVRLGHRLAVAVYNDAALEGNPYTLPEVQTLIEGTTVGGHALRDEREVLGLAASHERLREAVLAGEFELGRDLSDRLNAMIDVDSIETGVFRGEGAVSGGGYLGGTGEFEAPAENLDALYKRGLDELSVVESAVERAAAYFVFATYYQFYFNGNKRTARAMMNGELMSHGFDAITVPARQKLRYNEALIDLFSHGDGTPMMAFLVDLYRDTERKYPA